MAFRSSLSSQETSYYTISYTTQDHLPHNRIDAIVQDHSGFLWIGTWNGLSRFDGNEFVNYFHDPDDPASIPHFAIYSICCDHKNNVWIVPPAGFPLGLYDRKNDCFISYSMKQKGKYHIHSERFSVSLDKSGTLWIMGGEGIERFNDNTHAFDLVRFDEPIPDYADDVLGLRHLKMIFDDNNNIWFFSKDQLFKAELIGNKDTPVIKKVMDYHFDSNISCDISFKFFTNANGAILCISNFGWYYCQASSNTFRRLEKEKLPEPFNLPDTIVWSTFGKIHVRMGSAKTVDVIIDKNKVARSTLIDKSGNLWYTDQVENANGYKGLKKVTFIRNNFKNLLFRDLIPANPIIFSICMDKSGQLILATNSAGLIKWDSKTVKIKEIVNLTQSSFPEGVLLDNQQNLWVSYHDFELVRYNDKLRDPVVVLPKSARRLGIDFIMLITVLEIDLQNNIIIGGSGGLAVFNPWKMETLYSMHSPGQEQVRSVCVNSKNNLIIGTQKNLICLDRKTNDTTEIHLPLRNNYWIESICQYNDSIYWLGLLGGGICKWNQNTGTFKVYTTKDGLCNNTVYCILKDKMANLWISTNEGISCFNPVSGHFINYGVNEGLKISEFNSGASYEAPDGELLFGGLEGAVRFYPDSIRKALDILSSNLLITDFRVSGKKRFFESPVYESTEIRLDPGTDNFQLGFSLLEFNRSDRVKYRYLLEKHNNNWIYTDNRHRFVNYINLKPGKYRFVVEATDNLGNWSKHRILSIFIPAKFYQTTWFKALILLLCLSLLFIIIYNRYRVLILKEKRKKDQLSMALKESKLEMLRKQLNPHFIYNSLNSINYYISLNDKIKASQFITDFARLMRNILDNSSQDMIDFDKEMETLNDYLILEKVRFGSNFTYEIQADESINRMLTQVMPSMVQPFAENAIIHGLSNLKNRDGRLSIHFTVGDDHSVFCTIEDNGIGRKRSEAIKPKDQKKRKSKGMEIITERLAIFNAINRTRFKVVVEDADPARDDPGTRVIIQIPAREKT